MNSSFCPLWAASCLLLSGTVLSAESPDRPVPSDLQALEQSKRIAAQDPGVVLSGYQTRSIEGWTVLISEEVLKAEPVATAHALQLLTAHLQGIIHVVPPKAVAFLRTVPLWISPKYPDVPPHAEYHPGAGWLSAHGRNVVMTKGVEFTNVDTFEKETLRMPVFVLHELSHAYHDQVLGFDNPEIKTAYDHAKDSGAYDRVERWNGPDRPITHERAYAMTNEREYFAESTEAFFGRNDFFPFTRDELEKTDPGMSALLRKLWQVPAP